MRETKKGRQKNSHAVSDPGGDVGDVLLVRVVAPARHVVGLSRVHLAHHILWAAGINCCVYYTDEQIFSTYIFLAALSPMECGTTYTVVKSSMVLDAK